MPNKTLIYITSARMINEKLKQSQYRYKYKKTTPTMFVLASMTPLLMSYALAKPSTPSEPDCKACPCPGPFTVSDISYDGHYSTIARESIIKHDETILNDAVFALLSPSFDQSGKNILARELMFNTVTFPSFESYKLAVHSTMSKINVKQGGAKDRKTPKNLDSVLRSIYDAAACRQSSNSKNGQDLVIFTAVAMHNNYSFYQFPKQDKNNDSNVCRGLMQIKSDSYYADLTAISKSFKNTTEINFTAEKWRLNQLTAETIACEFKLYQNYFAAHCKGTSNIAAIFLTIEKMKSDEGVALATRTELTGELKKKLENRINIFGTLLMKIEYQTVSKF